MCTTYVKKEGGRGFASIEGSVETAERTKTFYSDQEQNKDQQDNKIQEAIKQKWEKQSYGHFKRQTSEISQEKTWTWLKKKRETLKKLNLF